MKSPEAESEHWMLGVGCWVLDVLPPAAKSLLPLLLLLAPSSLLAGWALVESVSRTAPAGIEFREAVLTDGAARATMYQVRCSPKTHTFAVMDNPAGDYSLATAAQKRGALAAVNGGYFHPDRTPLGLVVRKGAVEHPMERAKLLSGLVVVTADRVALRRAGEFTMSPAVREALQAGPFLVDGGKPVAGLNAVREAARTVVFTDATGRFGFVVCKSVTLAEMAAILATPDLFPGGKITRALNLDGGSSTGLWVKGEPAFHLREGKEVRNYLGVVGR